MRENFFCNKIDRLTRTEVKSIPGLKFFIYKDITYRSPIKYDNVTLVIEFHKFLVSFLNIKKLTSYILEKLIGHLSFILILAFDFSY